MNAAVYPEPYKLPAGILPIAVHGAFFALLYFGFTWQTLSPATMSVELWQSLPDNAVVEVAPPPVEPPPLEPKIEKIVPPTQPEEAVKPEIVMPEKEKPDARLAEQRAAREKAERIAREKAEQAAREKAERIAREKVEQVAREKAERIAREQAEQAERVAREKAEQAAAIGRVVDEYTGKIVSKIRRNIVMPPDVMDDARVEFSVTLLPGGTVLSAKMSKSSGNAAYDNAVERAILKSQPLPLPSDVALFNRFRKLELVFKPIE